MLTPEQQQQIIENAIRQKQGGKQSGGGLFGQLGRQFGPFGELIGMVADVLAGGRRPKKNDISDALNILTEQGFRVTPGGGSAPAGVPPDEPAVTRPRTSQPPPFSTKRSPQRIRSAPSAEPWPVEQSIQTLPTRVMGAFNRVPEDVQGISPEILTPESSNVYSVQYDYDTGLLYVRFNAEGPATSHKKMTSICTGREYNVGVRPHSPGPLYSYGSAGRGIPPEKFGEFVAAASKGQWVWQNLRVCGSDWQHQYPYTLTSVPTDDSHVPRKATRRGLRVRTVPTVGQGRRGGRQSTLPQRLRG